MRLHYIYDPLCGWCYAVKPLVDALNGIVEIVAHGGGMLAGANRRPMTPQFRNYLIENDRIIADATGQTFGIRYRDDLLADPAVLYDSEPPTAAVLVAERLEARGLEMLGAVQTAHYCDGRRVSKPEVLVDLAALMGFDRDDFATALRKTIGMPAGNHFAESRALMRAVGASGFPTFALEQDGRFAQLEYDDYLGRPQAWAQHVSDRSRRSATKLSANVAG